MASPNSTEYLYREIAELPLFEGMSKESVLEVLAGGSLRLHKHREILYHAGDEAGSFSLVLNGAYKLIRPTPRGDDLIVYFATPGDVIGALVMGKSGSSYPVTAKAMGPSRCYVIPKSTFQKSWAGNALLQQRLNSFLYSRMSLIQDEKTMARAPLPQRVAALLLQLLERSSRENEQILPLPLTRQEIADSLGVAVESVIRIMSDWSHHGIIRTNDRLIEILKPERIIEIIKES
ncbi:MAG TPA: Crp/Fnr family transcriptional regulator [Pseudobdellovibrionaceae bacterium]|nr:Crp/Fnr family transcriptional regulator [Pseudobdellovibrionaceae bacterium]